MRSAMSGRLTYKRTVVFAFSAIALTASLWLKGCGPAQYPDLLAQPGQPDVIVSQLGSQPATGTTKKKAGAPGIGGTGQTADAQPGIGGTGIIGTITGFGSILVNGYKVDYPANLPITFEGRTATPLDLRIGHVVMVEAEQEGSGLTARTIAVRKEVTGPIESIDYASRTAVVLGQKVEIPSGAVADSGGESIAIQSLGPGDTISVSGQRKNGGVIAATRIDKTGPGGRAVLRGSVDAVDDRGFTVNGVRVDAPADTRAPGLAVGQQVRVIGSPGRRRLRPRRIDVQPTRPFGGRMRNLSVEGYVARDTGGRFRVGRHRLGRLPAGAQANPGNRVIIEGRFDKRGRLAPARLRRSQWNRRIYAPRRFRQRAYPPGLRRATPPRGRPAAPRRRPGPRPPARQYRR